MEDEPTYEKLLEQLKDEDWKVIITVNYPQLTNLLFISMSTYHKGVDLLELFFSNKEQIWGIALLVIQLVELILAGGAGG